MTIEIFYFYTDDTSSNEEIEGKDLVYKTYIKNSRIHRLDGPAVEHKDGSKEYYVEGKRHRLDGPAVEYVGVYKLYYVEGKLHRLDGPAMEYKNGSKYYFVNDVNVTDKLEGLKEEDIPKYLYMLSVWIKHTCLNKLISIVFY